MKKLIQEKLAEFQRISPLPEKYFRILCGFFDSYIETLEKNGSPEKNYLYFFNTFIDLLKKQFASPFTFQIYHQKICSPFDYYAFGINFVLPLVDLNHSSLKGSENLAKIQSILEKKENVVLLANHQTEIDPQAISILLKDAYPAIAKKIIYVAGERVISDPLAIPFSMGCDLICIFSKKYINKDPGTRHKKQLHNKKAMEITRNLLSEGGGIIYVAPSGGRDRPNSIGKIEVAHFNPQSLEMFFLMAKKAVKKTHFFPLSLNTFQLLPPPDTTQVELGEKRKVNKVPIGAFFGNEIFLDDLPGNREQDKTKKRQFNADFIYNLVKKQYESLI